MLCAPDFGSIFATMSPVSPSTTCQWSFSNDGTYSHLPSGAMAIRSQPPS